MPLLVILAARMIALSAGFDLLYPLRFAGAPAGLEAGSPRGRRPKALAFDNQLLRELAA